MVTFVAFPQITYIKAPSTPVYPLSMSTGSMLHLVKSGSSPGQSPDEFQIRGGKDGRAEVGLGQE